MNNKKIIYWTAGLSIFALVTHAIDAPDHLTEWWGYGTFFVIIAAFQFFYGLALLLQPWRYDEEGKVRPDADRAGRPYFILGTVLTSLVIALYIITRTSGMPFFGTDAVREPLNPLSLLPPLESVALLYCHVLLLYRTRGRLQEAVSVSDPAGIDSQKHYPPGQTPT